MPGFRIRLIAISFAMCVLVACEQRTSTSAGGSNAANPTPTAMPGTSTPATSTGADEWVNNGATACDKYLTPDLVGSIFKNSNGQSHRSDSRSCTFEAAHQPATDFSTINIYLRNGGADLYDADPTTRNGTPIQGVGDKAVRTQEDGIQAVKGERICSVYVKPPFGNKIKGEVLAQRLGDVCTKLFALP
ncbi:MAG: hypothetical protein ABI460_08055 [Caldimonas sp.]